MKQRRLFIGIIFLLTFFSGLFFLNYDNLTFSHNLWQYILIIIGLIASIVNLFFDSEKLPSEKRHKTLVIIWALSLGYMLFIVIQSVVSKKVDLWMLITAIMIVLATSVNLWEYVKKIKSR